MTFVEEILGGNELLTRCGKNTSEASQMKTVLLRDEMSA